MSTTGKIMYKWVTFQQAMFDYRRVPKIYIRYIRYYLASKISHTLRLNTHVLYIISLNLVQCGHIYTYSDVCPHLSILYSIFSVLPYTMTIYIYSLVWWLWWGWSNSVSHFVLDEVCCLWVHIFIFYYTISYIMYHIQYVFIYI